MWGKRLRNVKSEPASVTADHGGRLARVQKEHAQAVEAPARRLSIHPGISGFGQRLQPCFVFGEDVLEVLRPTFAFSDQVVKAAQ